MIDTTEAGGGSYPSPNEEKTKYVKGTITLTYEFEDDEIPIYWDENFIKDYIKENLNDYLQELKEIEEIEILGGI